MPNKNKPAKDTRKPKDTAKPAERLRRKIETRVSKIKAAKGLPNNNTVSENRLELLITTVSRSKGEYYADLIQSFDVNMQFIAMGHGTADAKTMSMLGFTDSDKTVIFSVIQGNKLQAALDALEEKFRTIKNGKGIAYTVPLSGVIGKLIFGFLSNNRSMIAENKENK
ncbi:MAG: hypothetical protein K2F90_06465 [Clostridiales bacterium]|nr:hypothetical protein [Clostridiales bacterium]